MKRGIALLRPLVCVVFLGLAFAQTTTPLFCAVPGKEDPKNLSGVVNTYYPGAATVGAGGTSISLGVPRGDTTVGISPGDLLMVIQMQDAGIVIANDSTYGEFDASKGGINNAGRYEYVRATSALAAGASGTLTLSQPLQFAYTRGEADASMGQRRFQVVRIPQYSSATVTGTITAAPWNGDSGGIVALDVAGKLDFAGGKIDVTGQGFRGGGAIRTSGISEQPPFSATSRVLSNTDWTSPAYSTLGGDSHGTKGEGIAGTPSTTTDTPRQATVGQEDQYIDNPGGEGYPHAEGLTQPTYWGSHARGAPANAGGGATDGMPRNSGTVPKSGGGFIEDGNSFNAGGGGGANAGTGGNGGANWATTTVPPTGVPTGTDIGGRGGKSIVAASNQASRLYLGGGGGSGSINDGLAYTSSGANGGGMVIVRADSIGGSGAINADGNAALNVLPRKDPSSGVLCCEDGAGGGGAGGTVVLQTRDAAGLAGLTVTAKGGDGGNTRYGADPSVTPTPADRFRHGPGGGGGGGAIYASGATAGGSSVAGGGNGITATGDAFLAKPGAAGFINNSLAGGSIPGAGAGFECVPNLTISKTSSSSAVAAGTSTLSYTVQVANAAGRANANGVSIVDAIPAPFTYVPASVTYTLAGGASGPTPVPTSGNVVFGVARGDATNSFSIPGGGSVSLTYTVNLNGASANTYKNSATARYLDPQRTAPSTSSSSEKEVGPAIAPVTVGSIPIATSKPKANDDETTTPLNTPVTFGTVNQPGNRNVPAPAYNDVPTPGTNLVPSTIDLDPSTPGQQVSKNVPGKGTFTLDPGTGNVTFTPDPGFTGTVSIPYTIDDNNGQRSNSADLKVTIIPAPKAVDDSATTAINTPVVLDAPANDVPGDGARLVPSTIDLDPSTPGQQTSKAVPGQGTFTLNPDGTVTFTPEPGFTGTVTVPYTIQDNLGQTSNPANLTVVIKGVPTAVDDRVRTPFNTPVTIPFASNDVPSSGATIDPCTIDLDPSTTAQETSKTIVGKGTFTLSPAPACTLTFTPFTGYSGTVDLPYSVKDSSGALAAPAVIHVTIVPPPAAGDDATTTPLNTPVTFGGSTVPSPATNDLAGNGAVLVPGSIDLDPTTPGQQTSKTTPEGTFTLDPATGNVTFTPVAGFTGTATTPYTIKDDLGQTSNVANISVTIAPPKPTAAPDNTTTPINTPVKLNPIANDNGNGVALDPCTIDLDPSTPGQQTSFTVVGKGTFVLNAGVCDVTFTPETGFTGTVTTPYTIGQKGNPSNISNPADLTVVVNATPAAQPDQTRTPYNTPVTFGAGGVAAPSANDKAPTGKTINPGSIDLDPSTATEDKSITVPGQGTWTADANGNVTFTPVAGFTGVATITYTIKDSSGTLTNTTTLTVVVDPPPQPIANNDSEKTPYNTPVTLDPAKNDTAVGGKNPCSIDLDPGSPGQQTSYTVPGKGTYVLNPAPACTVTFTPVDGFGGEVTIPYTIEDNLGQRSNPATITVIVAKPEITLEKTASQASVKVGANLDYTLKLTNGAGNLTNVQMIDTLPVGLVYLDGTSKLGGVAIADPVKTVVNGHQKLTWNLPNLAAGQNAILTFSTKVTAAAQNPLINTAEATGLLAGSTTAVSSVASATTRIDQGVFSLNGEILGRVYFDRNDDNNFTEGTDEPLQGARVYLSNGRFAVTDDLGRYSITDVEPGLYAIRIDRLTAPYALKPVPDYQGQPGTRYVRVVGAGIDHEDFIFGAPKVDVSRVRATRVTRGEVTVEKVVSQVAPNVFTITLTITVGKAVQHFSLTDPLPAGATRAGLAGPGLQPSENGSVIALPGVLQPGTYTLAYTLSSNLPLDQVVTDPDLFWDEVNP